MFPCVGVPSRTIGRLACVVQNEAGKNDEIPRPSNGYFAKMAHVGIERFSPRYAQKDSAKDEKALCASGCQILDATEWIDRGHYAGCRVIPYTPSAAMTANQTNITGPNACPIFAVPSGCTTKSANRTAAEAGSTYG